MFPGVDDPEVLAADHDVIMAARIARVFRIDPVAVLNGSRWEMNVRIAALIVVGQDQEAADRRSEAKAKADRGR